MSTDDVADSHEIREALEGLDRTRRDLVSQVAAETSPLQYIRSIESSEVMITINPDRLPYGHIDYDQFISDLSDLYSLSLKPSKEIDGVLREQFGIDPGGLDAAARAKFSLLVSETIVFRDGRFPTGTSTFVPVQSLRFGQQVIAAKVKGRTEIAELLVAEAFELMWKAAGAPMKWENEAVQGDIAAKGYATHTKVDCGRNVLGLLSAPFVKFLQENLNTGLRFGAQMMSRTAANDFAPPSNVAALVGLNDLVLIIPVIDLVTGFTERQKISFSVTTQVELGTGRIEVYSELPYEDHEHLVTGVVEALRVT